MRLWHKDLIPVLPRKQLLAQWRECVLIAKNLAEKGTPNHILVNRILDYPAWHFERYGHLIEEEMIKRGYNITEISRFKFDAYTTSWAMSKGNAKFYVDEIFKYWHNDTYLLQCFSNLQEKYNCGGITQEEYDKVVHSVYLHFSVFNVHRKSDFDLYNIAGV